MRFDKMIYDMMNSLDWFDHLTNYIIRESTSTSIMKIAFDYIEDRGSI